jgi:hypothetical protein
MWQMLCCFLKNLILFSTDINISRLCTDINQTFISEHAAQQKSKVAKVCNKTAYDCHCIISWLLDVVIKVGHFWQPSFLIKCHMEVLEILDSTDHFCMDILGDWRSDCSKYAPRSICTLLCGLSLCFDTTQIQLGTFSSPTYVNYTQSSGTFFPPTYINHIQNCFIKM